MYYLEGINVQVLSIQQISQKQMNIINALKNIDLNTSVLKCSSVRFVRNSATQASWLQQKRYNSVKVLLLCAEL